MENKSNNKFYVPLLIALFFAGGIYLGINFIPKESVNTVNTVSSNDKLSTILDIIEERYVDEVDRDELLEGSIEGVFKKLDPHSRYIPAKNLSYENEQLKGNFGGIGIRFLIFDDTLVVTHVLPNSPSKFSGLLPGDRIIQVNDSILNKVELSTKKVMELLKGEAGTSVELKVYRKGIIKNISIIRGSIPVNSVVANIMLTKEVGFIMLNGFTEKSANEFIDAALRLKKAGMKKLIFDLRNNGGGYMQVATQIIDQFLPSGRLMVYTEGRAEERVDYISTHTTILDDVELIVLINSNSASASEIVAGAIQDNDRGLILGRRSFGKGLVQDQTPFTDGSALRLTISRYYTPTGRSIQKPYGEDIDYNNDYLERYKSGELFNEDSLKFDESLKFTTPAGRVVYGGGGIYPDVFIPNDTSGASYYLTSLYYGSAFNHWAFKYLDNKRQKWTSFSKFNKQFNVNDAMLKDFVEFASEKLSIEKDEDGLMRSKDIIKNRMKAELARHLFEENAYYKIYLKDDLDVSSALKELKKGIKLNLEK